MILKKFKKNKKGSITGWTEGILLSIAFVLVFGIVVTNMNGLYSQDHQVGLGTSTSANELINYQDTASAQISGGTANFDSASGITLSSSWGMLKEVFSIVGNFLTGGWIEQIFSYTNLGEAGQVIAQYLRVIWVLGLIFTIIYILFKVKP